MQKQAWFSACHSYRYALSRIWDTTQPYALFIGLNPSTADATTDDPTLRRCQAFARNWGYGGLYMANLFAYRATKPEDMKSALDPIGRENNSWIIQLTQKAGIIVAAWGNDGAFQDRGRKVLNILPTVYCLKINRSGQPAHPLYQKASTQPTLLKPGSGPTTNIHAQTA